MSVRKLTSVFIFVALLVLSACATPTSTPTSQPTVPPTATVEEIVSQTETPTLSPEPTFTDMPELSLPTSEPFPPLVRQTIPEQGGEHQLDAQIEVVFDQPMNHESVETSFQVIAEPLVHEEAIEGSFTWSDDDTTIYFTPATMYQRGKNYVVMIDQTATSSAGLHLNRPTSFRFNTVGFLEITNVQPTDKATNLDKDTIITVLFNRPVVPLQAIGDPYLIQPLMLEPAVKGEGKWLNTSIYQFIPSDELALDTKYIATIPSGLTSMNDGVLEEDFTWSFSTSPPRIVDTHPDMGDLHVSTTPVISLAFNQKMDREHVESSFSLKDSSTNQTMSGKFTWLDNGIRQMSDPYNYHYDEETEPTILGVETVAFTPNMPLDFDTQYTIIIGKNAKGLEGQGSNIVDTFMSTFRTIPALKIHNYFPKNDEIVEVDEWGYQQQFEVQFNAPVNPDTFILDETFFISPPISQTEVYSYFSDNQSQFNINFPAPGYSKTYTVTIDSAVESRYGQPLSESDKGITVQWQTGTRQQFILLNTENSISTRTTLTDTVVYITVSDVPIVDFKLYMLSENDFINVTTGNLKEYKPNQSNLIREWQINTPTPANKSFVYKTNLADEGSLAPGFYYLEVSSKAGKRYATSTTFYGGGENVIRHVLIVSEYNLTMKTTLGDAAAWLTSLDNAEPISHASIRFLMKDDKNITELGNQPTDESGVATITHDRPKSQWGYTFFAISDKPFAVASSTWNDGIRHWDFDNVSSDSNYDPYNGFLYTDRPLYRPEQIVYFKGILRYDDDAVYTRPSHGQTVTVEVTDMQGKEIYADELSLNENGTFHGELTLDAEAALGTYFINVTFEKGDYRIGDSFNVAEYRKPEFMVNVETDEMEYITNDTILLTAKAEYFFGGPVSNAEVRYNILAADYSLNVGHASSLSRYRFTDYEHSYSRRDSFYPGYGTLIEDGTGTTNAQGKFNIEVSADIADKLASQRFTLEAVVIDPDSNQEVANRMEAIVHKGEYYIGLKPRLYIGNVNEETEIDVITVDWDSDPAPDKTLTVVYSKHNWYSVRVKVPDSGHFIWESVVEDVPVFTDTVTTDKDGMAVSSFVPETGGIYKISAQGMDSHGNEIRSSTYLWVSGRGYVNWRQENNDRIDLITDKNEYDVGDTATILIAHPYSSTVMAWVTQERGHIYNSEVITLETNSEQIEIPITEDMVPNMYVSVVIMSRPYNATITDTGVSPDSGLTINPLPTFKVGYVSLPINNRTKIIDLTLTPSADIFEPGDSVTYDISAVDAAGNPVEGEFSLALVDKAVLTLMDESGPTILEQFWRERGLAVETATGLAISAERFNLEIAPLAKGGGGGGGDFSMFELRSTFKDTAFWLADFTTDKNGHGEISIELPDNLTTWVLTARGISADDRTLVGDKQIEIVTTKPLLVRPVIPRFLVVGDKTELKMIMQNNTAEELDVTAFFAWNGVEFLGDEYTQEVTIASHDKVTLIYPIEVITSTLSKEQTAFFQFGVNSETYQDAVELEIPVYKSSSPETVGTSGVLETDETLLEGIILPHDVDSTQGQVTINLASSLAGGMQAGLTYLEHFPYECTEQTVSRFLPNVVTYRVFQQLDITKPDLEEQLPVLVSTGLQRLYANQHLDGGWGWWARDESNLNITAYVLFGLLEAQTAGFTVDETVLENGISFLENNLRKPKDVKHAWQANRQAYMLHVLAKAGAGDMGRTVALFEQREKLGVYGRAYLAMTFAMLDENDTRINSLISTINSEAILSATGTHWEENRRDYWAMNTNTRSTAIVISMLSRLDPENALLPNAVRWLMSARKADRWETTQETAWAIIGLTDWMVATGEPEGNYRWAVNLNGDDLGEGVVSKKTITDTISLAVDVQDLLLGDVNRLIIDRSPQKGDEASQGKLYYTAHLEYYKPIDEIQALDRGIVVARKYTLGVPSHGASNLGLTNKASVVASSISEAQVGDIITVKVTIIAPNNLYHVVVEDPIPAGTEVVDISLNTTSIIGKAPEVNRSDRRNGWGWWWFSHTELRDERAVLFATYLPKGTYEYTYQIRASIAGEYHVIPTHAEEMYFPEVFGHGDGSVFVVHE